MTKIQVFILINKNIRRAQRRKKSKESSKNYQETKRKDRSKSKQEDPII